MVPILKVLADKKAEMLKLNDKVDISKLEVSLFSVRTYIHTYIACINTEMIDKTINYRLATVALISS